MAGESYIIKVRQQGAREVKRSIEDIGAGAKRTTNSLEAMRKGLNLLLGLYGLTALQQYADEYQNLDAKLKIATHSTEELARAEDQLFRIANRTYSSFSSTVDLYARFERSTRSLKISQDNLLQITETVNKAIALSGASTQAANAAILQLGQGMAAGTLRGDELNSVLEQAPRLAEAIATGMGVAVGNLKRLGEQGLITTEQVLNALASQGAAIDEEFLNVNLTIGKAMEVLNNQILRAIGQLDSKLGISSTIAKALVTLSQNLDQVAGAALGAAAGLAVMYAPSLLKGLVTVTRLVKGLTLAMVSNPFGAIAVAAATLIGYLTVMGDQIQPLSDSFATVADFATAGFDMASESLSGLYSLIENDVNNALNSMQGLADELFSKMGPIIDQAMAIAYDAVNKVIGAFVVARKIAATVFEVALRGASSLWEGLTAFYDFSVGLTKSLFQTVGGIADQVSKSTGITMDRLLVSFKNVLNTAIGVFTIIPRLAYQMAVSVAKNFEALFEDIGNMGDATMAALKAAFSGGDFTAAFEAIRSQSNGALTDMRGDMEGVLKETFSKDYVGDLITQVGVLKDQFMDTFGSDLSKDYLSDAQVSLSNFYKEFKARAEDAATARLAAEQEVTAEYEKQDKIITDSPAFSTDQIAEFTKKLNGMRETLNGMNPTWERSLEVIGTWRDGALDAVDKNWERYQEYADMVNEVTREKITAAYWEMMDSSENAFEGMISKANEMQKEYDNVAALMKKGIGTVIDGLTNQLMQFAMTGKLSFRELASSLAMSIAQMMMRMLVMRAVLAALNVIPGFSAAMAGADVAGQAMTGAGAAANFAQSTATLQQGMGQAQAAGAKMYAKGGIFSKGVEMFANGAAFTNSVVSRPTNFAMAGGLGMMGEAGPEAIMPLSRGSDGKLGVQASGSASPEVNVYFVQSAEEAAELMAQNPKAVNKLVRAIDEVKG
ncbi:tail length tape measure protein [Vibrio phage vB_VpaS_MAR10]|uniref:Tail tape measure protein n=1 Tax=Vibrio phage vB_VpaS_MAR10 TaxID=1229755 RepID=K7RVL7_9CAUD|nr:tail length tape measure protein [Vibrio phage vB_VpaS_MAR10]AFV81275.1 tail tape measure protein [Vibrio phage vB_VpaS_MAR10]